MARNGDAHPTPDDPNDGPVPHIPSGTVRADPNPPAEPSITDNDEVPGGDYPPERRPFPDHTPDPGVSRS